VGGIWLLATLHELTKAIAKISIGCARSPRSPFNSRHLARPDCCSADGAIRFRLPSLTIRAHLRNVEARSDDFVLPEIF
jgi:hypothetical protein